jgi:hypothetical protein
VGGSNSDEGTDTVGGTLGIYVLSGQMRLSYPQFRIDSTYRGTGKSDSQIHHQTSSGLLYQIIAQPYSYIILSVAFRNETT